MRITKTTLAKTHAVTGSFSHSDMDTTAFETNGREHIIKCYTERPGSVEHAPDLVSLLTFSPLGTPEQIATGRMNVMKDSARLGTRGSDTWLEGLGLAGRADNLDGGVKSGRAWTGRGHGYLILQRRDAPCQTLVGTFQGVEPTEDGF